MNLRIVSLMVNFAVISFIGLKTLSTECFNAGDISFAMVALIFSVIAEIYSLKK